MFEITWYELLIYQLIVWGVTGLTVLHLAVLVGRSVRRAWNHLRPRRLPDAPPTEAPEPTPPLSLSFLVPVYNESVTIAACLESLLAQTDAADAIVVVNDGSTDDTRDALEPFLARGVTLIDLPANLGKTRALEAVLGRLHTELVAITDADSLVDPDYVREIRCSFADPDVVAAAGAVESLPHTWITAARQVEYLVSMKLHRNAETSMNCLWILPGASTTYRRRALCELGFEHDTIGEDLDLTWRLHKAGHRAVMNMRAKVYTSDPPTIRAYYRQTMRWHTDIWICVKKHRDLFGRKLFGTVQLPLTLLNLVMANALYVLLPFYFLLFDLEHLLPHLLLITGINLALTLLAYAVHRQPGVCWNLLSHYPTRFVSRFTLLAGMVLVLVGRTDGPWRKLDRLRTDDVSPLGRTRARSG